MSEERNEPAQKNTKHSGWAIWPESWFVVVILLLVMVLALGPEFGSPKARDLILLFGGVFGIGLAAWRGSVLQGNLNLDRERSSRDDRFRKKQLAMEQLASDNPVVRRAGEFGLIAAMEDEEEERPQELAELLSEYISYNGSEIQPSDPPTTANQKNAKQNPE